MNLVEAIHRANSCGAGCSAPGQLETCRVCYPRYLKKRLATELHPHESPYTATITAARTRTGVVITARNKYARTPQQARPVAAHPVDQWHECPPPLREGSSRTSERRPRNKRKRSESPVLRLRGGAAAAATAATVATPTTPSRTCASFCQRKAASKDAPSVGFCSSSRSPTSSRKFSVHFLT